MRRSPFGFVVVLLLILLFSKTADACSCANPGPPCGSYGDASVIFLGRVVGSVQRKTSVDQDGNKTIYDVGTIRFLVQENFKGTSGYEVEINSGTGGGDCGYWFLRNESYVVYAYRSSEDNKLYTNICTRTQHVSHAKEDLDFLRSLSNTKPGATLYGRLIRLVGDPEHGPVKEDPKMAGVKVVIKGANQTLEASTNDQGEYKVTGLPSGDYDVFPQLPDSLGALASHDTVDRFGSYSGHKPVSLSDRACAEMSFSVQFSGIVGGKVVSTNGDPAKDIQVNLAKEDDAEKEWSAWTDEDGRYEFHMVQPGNYLLGFNLRWSPNKDDPYPKTFYPGVRERSEAALITVGEGEKLKGYDLTLPSPLKERELKVTVAWPDGRPAAGAYVDFEMSEGTTLGERATTDAKGVVSIKVFDNYRYTVYANAERGKNQDVHSEPIEIVVNEKLKPLNFVLSRSGYGYEDKEALKRKTP